MKKRKLLFVTGVIAVIFTSCQKEIDFQDLNGQGGGNNIVITGNWSFIGTSAKTSVSITVSQAGQQLMAVTTSDYTSENNTGTLNVTNNQFIFSGIGYTVNTMTNVKTYLNGVLFDDSDRPFNQTSPATDQTYDYVRNSNDSLTFTNADAFFPDPSGQTSTGPTGAKISLVSDTLTMIVKKSFSGTMTQGGIPGSYQAKLDGIMKFKKE